MRTHHSLDPIVELMERTMASRNLVNSACLQIFDFLRRLNNGKLTQYVWERYGARLAVLEGVRTFGQLHDMYDWNKANPQQAGAAADRLGSGSMLLDSLAQPYKRRHADMFTSPALATASEEEEAESKRRDVVVQAPRGDAFTPIGVGTSPSAGDEPSPKRPRVDTPEKKK